MDNWSEEIEAFIAACFTNNVKMLMVGGGAVNFHGYQRHSADIDFWIDTSKMNLSNLLLALREIGIDVDKFPEKVENQEQNISLKFSPEALHIELITNFNVNKTFDEAYQAAIEVKSGKHTLLRYRVLSLEDLVTSKIKAGRPKDLLDIQELQRIRNTKK